MRTSLLLFFTLVVISAATARDNASWEIKVEKAVMEKARAGNTFEFMVILNEQAKLDAADQMETKKEKGAYVCQQLIETANRSQAPVLEVLERSKIMYKKYWIVNAIW